MTTNEQSPLANIDDDLFSNANDPLIALSPHEIDSGLITKPNALKKCKERFFTLAKALKVTVQPEVSTFVQNETNESVLFFLLVLLSRELRKRERTERSLALQQQSQQETASRLETVNPHYLKLDDVQSTFRDICTIFTYYGVPKVFYDKPPTAESHFDRVTEASRQIQASYVDWVKRAMESVSKPERFIVELKHFLSDMCSVIDYVSRLLTQASEEYNRPGISDESRSRLLKKAGCNQLMLAQMRSVGADTSDLGALESLFDDLREQRNHSTHCGLSMTWFDGTTVSVDTVHLINPTKLAAKITGIVERVTAVVHRTMHALLAGAKKQQPRLCLPASSVCSVREQAHHQHQQHQQVPLQAKIKLIAE